MDTDLFDIRYTQISDKTWLKQWVEHPHNLCWFPMTEDKEIEEMVQCWIGFSRWCAGLTATINSTPCGMGTLFLMPYRKIAHQAMFNIVIDPNYQRQGIGTRLIKNLKHLAKNYFHLELLSIEVFEKNPLISMLKSQDFYEVFRQENYIRIDDQTYQTRVYLETHLTPEGLEK